MKFRDEADRLLLPSPLSLSLSTPRERGMASRWSFATRAGLVDGPLLIRTRATIRSLEQRGAADRPPGARSSIFSFCFSTSSFSTRMLDGGHCSLCVSFSFLETDGASKMLNKLVWLGTRELWSPSVHVRSFVVVTRLNGLVSCFEEKLLCRNVVLFSLSLFFLGGDCDAWVIR